MAQRTLTIKQCLDLYDLPEVIAQAGVTCDWPTSIDIAMNKEAVSAIAEGFRASAKKPPRVTEYEQRAEKARMTETGESLNEAMQKLNREYALDLIAENNRQRKLEGDAMTKTKSVSIVPIKRDAFTGSGKLVAIIASHLMPVFARPDGEDATAPKRKETQE